MWYWFVQTLWLYGMAIMGIVLAVQLIVKWKAGATSSRALLLKMEFIRRSTRRDC